MRKHLVFLLLSVAVFLPGCSSNNSSTSPTGRTDQQAVTSLVSSVDSIAQFLSSDEATINDGGLQLVTAGGSAVPEEIRSDLGVRRPFGTTADSVVEWGRLVFFDHITRSYNVVLSGDTLAYVTVTRNVPGDFLVAWGIRPIPTSDSVIVDTVIHKPFTEVTNRNIELKRVARNADPLLNWVVVAITFVTSKTTGSITFGIDSLQISNSRTISQTTYTNPLQTWFRFGRFSGSIPVFRAGDTITVRLSVSGSDSLPEVVTLHHGVAGAASLPVRARMFLVDQTGGPGNHTRIFQRKFVPHLPDSVTFARFNAVTDVFPRRCIYSKTAAFENEFWGMPYIVVH